MADREVKIKQIISFVQDHPESFASRAVFRRLQGEDYELGQEFLNQFAIQLQKDSIKEDDIDYCYDLIK